MPDFEKQLTMVYASLFARSLLLVEVIGFSLTPVFRKGRGAVADGPRGELDAVQAAGPAVVPDGLGCDAEAICEGLGRFQTSIAINLFQRGFGPRFDFSQNLVPAVPGGGEEIARGDTCALERSAGRGTVHLPAAGNVRDCCVTHIFRPLSAPRSVVWVSRERAVAPDEQVLRGYADVHEVRFDLRCPPMTHRGPGMTP